LRYAHYRVFNLFS